MTIERNYSSIEALFSDFPKVTLKSERNKAVTTRKSSAEFLGFGNKSYTSNEIIDFLKTYRAQTGALDVSSLTTGDAKTRVKTMQETGNFFAVDPSRYIGGEPFLAVRKRRRTGRIIDLKIGVNYHAGYSAQTAIKKAQILVDFIHAAENEGHQVALTVAYFGELRNSAEEIHKTVVTIKSAGEYMDASNLFVCVHPAFFRGLIIALMMLDSKTKVDGGVASMIEDPDYPSIFELTHDKLMELAK